MALEINEVQEDEVLAALSAGVWSTRNRIFEKVFEARGVDWQEMTDGQIGQTRESVRLCLALLCVNKLARAKREEEMTGDEINWQQVSQSNLDELEAESRRRKGRGGLTFYRLNGAGGKRKNSTLPAALKESLAHS